MPFEWDETKRRLNLRQHGVDFIDVAPLFDRRFVEWIDDRRNYGEIRMKCLGEIGGRVYAVVYTWRGGNRRLISARKANVREQRTYNRHDG
jgi:uncharacterized protein